MVVNRVKSGVFRAISAPYLETQMPIKETSRIKRALVLGLVLLTSLSWSQEEISSLSRERALTMLQNVSSEVRKHYYDPTFHGIDWSAKTEAAKQQIETAPSFNMALAHIAAALDSLNDSHTFFLPPPHVDHVDYGFQYQMVGDQCLVTRVRPGSDAESKGIKPGDQILAINGFTVNRDTLWKMQYTFSVLRPQLGLRLSLQDYAGNQRKVDAAAKVIVGKRVTDTSSSAIWEFVRQAENREHLMRTRYQDYGDALLVVQLPRFLLTQDEVEKIIDRARKYPNLIVDLRGNPGGSVDTLRFLLGGVFDREVKIAERVGRGEKKTEIAKPLHHRFTGKLVVLVDARSASAAELFARVVQLEKRGMVLGDRSSGSVMEARHYSEQLGSGSVIFYGASVTERDLIMQDGKSLEHIGVTPDEVVLPSSQDLAAGQDPVLAHATGLLGVKLSPEEAGKAFPYEWPPE